MIQRAMHDLQGGDEDHDGDPEFACDDGEHWIIRRTWGIKNFETPCYRARRRPSCSPWKWRRPNNWPQDAAIGWRRTSMVDRVVGTMVRQLKKVSKGKACNQVGRWHRDAQCPKMPQKSKQDQGGSLHGERGGGDRESDPLWRPDRGEPRCQTFWLVAPRMRLLLIHILKCALTILDKDHIVKVETGQRPSGSQHDGQPANLGDVYNDRSNPNGDSFVLLIVFRVCLMAVFRSVLCGAKFLGIGLKESILDLLEALQVSGKKLCGTIGTGCQRMAVGIPLRNFRERWKVERKSGWYLKSFSLGRFMEV